MADATAVPASSVTAPVELTPAGEALLASLCPPAPEGLAAEQEINRAAELLTVRAGYAAHLAATGMWASAAEYARSAARHADRLHALTTAAAGGQPADPPDQEVP